MKKVVQDLRSGGLLSAIGAVQNRLDQPILLGYASAGTIVALGAGVSGLQPGDRVACAGGGHAIHGEFAVIPKNLIALLPDSVEFESGAFATLGAIALHGLRLGRMQVGDRVAVIGLGLLGMLAVGLARAAGADVFGVDLDEGRVQLARRAGGRGPVRREGEGAAQGAPGG